MTTMVVPVLIVAVAIAVAWIIIDDHNWGWKRRVKILERLLHGPIPERDLACGRSARYVLLGKMQDEKLLKAENLGQGDKRYRYRITERGRAWLRAQRAEKTRV